MEPEKTGMYTYAEKWGVNVGKGYDVVGFYRRYPGLKLVVEIPVARRNNDKGTP